MPSPLPRLSTFTAIIFSLAIIVCPKASIAWEENSLKATAKNLPVQWAWSNDDVAQAGEGFWPQFRGPTGDGISPAKDLPVEWSENKNIAWKTELPGRGWSSPVIWGDEIWMTTATEDGKRQSVLVVDRRTGKLIRNQLAFENEKAQPDHHSTNSYASPTPVLDAQNAYVHFGAYGTAAISRKSGEIIWQRRDLPCNHFRGPGSSPILYGDLLIFHMDGFDHQYIVALNKHTGKTVWNSPRKIEYGTDNGDFYKAFATPTLIQVGETVQLISPTSKATLAMDPATGKELWRVMYEEFSATAKPLFDGQRLYLNSGFSKARLMAVRPDGAGDVTATHIDWNIDRGIGSKPSQLLYKDWIFNVLDSGVASCIRKSDGEVIWQERLGGDFSASPIMADGRIYLFDHDGKGYVFAADDQGKLLATNQLDSGCMSSPAAVGNSLYVRTRTHIYCLSQK